MVFQYQTLTASQGGWLVFLSVLTSSHMIGWVLSVCFPGSKDYQLVTWSRDQTLRIWRVDPQLQRVSVDRASRNVPVCPSHLCQAVVVIVQLCVSDGVEDLMESLTVESEKSLTSQEPDSHLGLGSTAEHLQGELTHDP